MMKRMSGIMFSLVLLGAAFFYSSPTYAIGPHVHGDDTHTEEQTGANNPKVLMKTSMGDVTFELDPTKAPITVKNFLGYVNSGHYNGTIFHRVIKDFMIQGGGMDKDMIKRPTHPPIKNEAYNGLKNFSGTIAMARTGVVDSATDQFFVNVENNFFLDHKDKSTNGFGYAAFGKVIEGMEVIKQIEVVRTGNVKGYQDVPLRPVTIVSMTEITEEKQEESQEEKK